jgi:hypothetical protein
LLTGPPAEILAGFRQSLYRIECFREAATMIMLGGIASLTAQSQKEKVVAFLWTFAFWDIFYYLDSAKFSAFQV